MSYRRRLMMLLASRPKNIPAGVRVMLYPGQYWECEGSITSQYDDEGCTAVNITGLNPSERYTIYSGCDMCTGDVDMQVKLSDRTYVTIADMGLVNDDELGRGYFELPANTVEVWFNVYNQCNGSLNIPMALKNLVIKPSSDTDTVAVPVVRWADYTWWRPDGTEMNCYKIFNLKSWTTIPKITREASITNPTLCYMDDGYMEAGIISGSGQTEYNRYHDEVNFAIVYDSFVHTWTDGEKIGSVYSSQTYVSTTGEATDTWSLLNSKAVHVGDFVHVVGKMTITGNTYRAYTFLQAVPLGTTLDENNGSPYLHILGPGYYGYDQVTSGVELPIDFYLEVDDSFTGQDCYVKFAIKHQQYCDCTITFQVTAYKSSYT